MMTAPWRRTVALGLALLATGPLASAEAPDGHVLVGDGKVVDQARTRGTWAPGVQLTAGAPGHMDVAVFPRWAFYDGEVTADLRTGAKPYVTVLVRAHTRDSPDGSLEGLSAVGLTVRGRYVRWDRWDGGVTLPIGKRAWVAAASRHLRITVQATGQTLTATVRDADSGRVLVTTSVRDGGSGTGAAGVRVQGDATSRVVGLRVTPKDPAGRGVVPSDPTEPLGTEHFLLLTADALAKAPADLGVVDLGVWPYDDRGLHGVVLPATSAWALRDAGLVTEARPVVPYWAWDPDVRRAARTVPLASGRPDLSASFKDPEMVEQVLDHWVRLHPTLCRKVKVGESHRGRPIWALRITDQPDADEHEPAVLITGATHGSELLSTEYALDAADALLRGYGTDEAVTRRVDGLDIWVVPLVNPDGNHVVHTLTRFGGRKNGRDTTANGRADPWEGVDLNRNFGLGFGRDEVASRSFPNSAYYRGEAAFSEPETRALRDLATTHRFAASVSFHTKASMILVPYTLDRVAQPTPNAAWGVAEQIAAATPTQPDGKALRVRRQIYPVDGTDQDWMRHTHGTVAFIVEGSHHNPEVRDVRLASVAALRPIVPTLLDRVLDGPTLRVRVLDGAGEPVPDALVHIEQDQPKAGERWTTGADGRHDRVLAPGIGRVRVTVTHPDGRQATASTTVTGRTPLDVVFPDP